MSSKHKKFRPYIRRLKPSDRADDWRTALRLAVYQMRNWNGWVMVQHGFPGRVMAVGESKQELLRSPFSVLSGRYSFKQWAREVQRHALGGRP